MFWAEGALEILRPFEKDDDLTFGSAENDKRERATEDVHR
jgi:hypothetical protein